MGATKQCRVTKVHDILVKSGQESSEIRSESNAELSSSDFETSDNSGMVAYDVRRDWSCLGVIGHRSVPAAVKKKNRKRSDDYR